MKKNNLIEKAYRKIKRSKGFTLLEMTVVMIIIGLLLLLIIPNVGAIRKHADNKQAEAMVELVQTQVNLYIAENGEGQVGFDDLKGYLTKDQIARAQKVKIEIGADNNVYRN